MTNFFKLSLQRSRVFESRCINEWIELKHPEPPLVPPAVDGRLAVKRFEVIADGACDPLLLMFFENAREASLHSPPWLARQQRKLDGALREFALVIASRPHAHGERFSITDIATGTLLRYLSVRWPDNPWRTQYPQLAAYSDRLEERAAATRPVPQLIRDRVARR